MEVHSKLWKYQTTAKLGLSYCDSLKSDNYGLYIDIK